MTRRSPSSAAATRRDRPPLPARLAKHVLMLVRGTRLADSMSDYLVQRIEASPRITLLTETEITALDGEAALERVTWTNRRTGATERAPIRNVFVMIGAVPNTEWLRGLPRSSTPRASCAAAPASTRRDADRLPYALATAARRLGRRRRALRLGQARRLGGRRRLGRRVGDPRGPGRVENPHSRAAMTSRITILFTRTGASPIAAAASRRRFAAR